MRAFLNRHYITVFFLPALLLACALIIYPMCYGLYISFFNTNLIHKWDFVGLKNYAGLLKNKLFIGSLGTTLKFVLLVVGGHFVLGTFLAVLLNKPLRGRAVYRCILLLPWLVPEVVYGMLYKWILNPQYGIFNYLLVNLGLLDAPITWLGDKQLAFYAVVLVSILKGFPIVMIMVLSALQTVSEDIYEAARMDGCGGVQLFFRITIPSIVPVLVVTMILDTVNWFKHYTLVAILTGGGPANTTSLVSVSIYTTAFNSFKFGQAGAMAVVVFVICFLFGVLYRRLAHE